MNKIELSIIIVTFNGEKYIKNCFDSIIQCCSDISYEIIVVDNNSKDNTVSIVKSNYKEVRLIESKINLGFAKGSNKAVEVSNGETILLLNHDTILLNNISTAVETVKSNNKIGALGIKMLDASRNYISSVGKFPKFYQFIRFSLFKEKSDEFLNGNFENKEILREVDWISGAFLLVRKEYWERVNGLDENYFMYVEDVDFCKKLNLIGKQIVFLPSLSFVHFVGFNYTRETLLVDGYKIYANKFFKGSNRIIAKVCLVINYGYKKVKQHSPH